MAPSHGAFATALPGKPGLPTLPKRYEVIASVELPAEIPASSKEIRRRSKPKPKLDKKLTAQCVGYYVDALDKKLLWGEARIIECNPITQKIKVHFVGWSKNYDLWTDPMSITVHGRYAPRTKGKTVKSWDGDMHLFEDMLGFIKKATVAPDPVRAGSVPRATRGLSVKKKFSVKESGAMRPNPIPQCESSLLKKRAFVNMKKNATSENGVVLTKRTGCNRRRRDPEESLKCTVDEARVEKSQSFKKQKRELLQSSALTSARACASTKDKVPGLNELPLFRDLELDDGPVLETSLQRNKARADHEARPWIGQKQWRLRRAENITSSMQRRYSFSCQSDKAIEKEIQKSRKSASFSKILQKASSLLLLSGDKSSPIYRSELREYLREKEQAAPCAKAAAVPHKSDAAPFGLDVEKKSDRFSDDDSDGSIYSSVCSDEKIPFTQSSVLSSWNSQVLCCESSSVGSKIQRKASDAHSSGIDQFVEKAESQLQQFSTSASQLSPKLSHDKLQEAEKNACNSEKNLPEWLLGKSILSPADSCTNLSMRSPHQIEDEIRFAVDSAAARVREELCRRELFKRELSNAAAYSTPLAPTNTRSAIFEMLSEGGNDFENLMLLDDKLYGVQDETEVQPQADHVYADGADCGDLLLLMEVVIDEGRTETIEIHEGDNPETLALAFAKTHALQPDAISKLRFMIQEQLNTLVEKEAKEAMSPEQPAENDWATDAEFDQFVSGIVHHSPVCTANNELNVGMNVVPSTQPEHKKHELENQREVNYNALMARYSHKSQHSGKIDFECQPLPCDVFAVPAVEYSPTTKRSSMSSTAPHFTTAIHSNRNFSTKKRTNLGVEPAYERLHALAESKAKWIQRAQKAKELEQALDEQQSHRVELMAVKSRELVANRTNGGYAHIGERLYEEALSDLSKKVERHERRVVEREHQHDWMCSKCAYFNRYIDSRCQNITKPARQQSKIHHLSRQETPSSLNGSFRRLDAHSKIMCGQPKPKRLFQPTLLTSSSNATKSIAANTANSSRMAILRRQRHEKAIADKFQQTCPFKPKINHLSEEIVRERKLKSVGAIQRPRNPHLDLYENSFQARALRNERESEYFKQFPFKPYIGINALWAPPDKSQSNFVERLAVNKLQELERKRVALHEKYAQDRDASTGKKFFRPEVGRAPAFARNKQDLPIGDFLYGAHHEQQEYHRQLREEKQRQITIKSQQTFVSKNSRQALKRRNAALCSRIFNALFALSYQAAPTITGIEPSADLSHDKTQEEAKDIVTPAQVNLSALPPEISRVVAIVFEFANHEPISRDAFLSCMDRLMRKVPGLSYSHLMQQLGTDKGDGHRPPLESDREAAERKELTFHPIINRNSREIALKHGRVPGPRIFQTLNQYYNHYLERKEQRHKQQQREFKKTHPFCPTMVTKLQSREPAASAFYDKIRFGQCEDPGNRAPSAGTSSNSVSPLYLVANAAVPPPAPLQTAHASARPCVRPILSERDRLNTTEVVDEDHLDEETESTSTSSLYTRLLDDTELMSRVLAALDEKPPSTYPPPNVSVDDEFSSLDKVGLELGTTCLK